ncbi:NAD(P)-dependent oxidoreductase [Paracoccus sp. 1_MG-2023]|uniref:NAD-dependent epimerase/dehydratase family protein n=1 Tax=unclassified Paracoccus (in: a-proteobacteria) TaxID=2688777 RepID=UPI001C0A1C37|nr:MULTISPECIES: NAD(P)-dependent oxidoreductase [unclassified Paracoccus (in: a-proteobacteria)]MBU2958155.1 NAD(P)-dependent oxidoreductase [Paracoccus sp. C2R09]MDO6668282.1 NAD(P)-dependent oxidoreductase [Paracoccus sp. 1_MG-2023]
MRVALTGATGIVGGFVHTALRAAGHRVTTLDRQSGWRLGQNADLTGQDALIHCAFAHAPGLYRGGEGDDPDAFIAANLQGSRMLFDDAHRAGVGRVLFLSSRAVHDGHGPGLLPDDLPALPANLYGRVKAGAEAHLAALPLAGCAIRATGVYGPGPAMKWGPLFRDHLARRPIAPRIGTEVHAADLAAAIILLLDHPRPPATVNVSDIALDRAELLGMVNEHLGRALPLPDPADGSALGRLDCTFLRRAGWQPRGMDGLRREIPDLLDAATNL